MPRLKVLSGRQVLQILRGFGFEQSSQRGSHVKVRRILENGQAQTLTIPDHAEIDRGTLHAIYRQACRFIADSELHGRFFAE
jgi:predicted RNA binding protein YcfA (HicA-like mRNA interferase family)